MNEPVEPRPFKPHKALFIAFGVAWLGWIATMIVLSATT